MTTLLSLLSVAFANPQACSAGDAPSAYIGWGCKELACSYTNGSFVCDTSAFDETDATMVNYSADAVISVYGDFHTGSYSNQFCCTLDTSSFPVDRATLIGTPGDDRLTLRVSGGSRYLRNFGTKMEALVLGGAGVDHIYGSAETNEYYEETLSGEEGDDFLFGRQGNDILLGGPGIDRLEGGPGDDVLRGGDGRDTLYGEGDFLGGTGDDRLFGDGGEDILDGGPGDDDLFVGPAVFPPVHHQEAVGGPGDDDLFGSSGTDTLEGGLGRDRLFGRGGVDFLLGGDENDTLVGGNGVDSLFGGDGNDVLSGGNGDDLLEGEDGNDTLWGGFGNDILRGQGNNDILCETEADTDNNPNTAGLNEIYGGPGVDKVWMMDLNQNFSPWHDGDGTVEGVNTGPWAWSQVATNPTLYVGSMFSECVDAMAL